MNLNDVDLEFNNYYNSIRQIDENSFKHYNLLSECYFRINDKFNKLPVLDHLSKETMEKQTRGLVIHDLGHLMKTIHDEAFSFFVHNQSLEINGHDKNIKNMTIHHYDSLEVEQFIYKLYQFNSSDYFKTLKNINNTIRTRKFWYSSADSMHNLMFERVNSNELMNKYRTILDRSIERLNLNQLGKTENGINRKKLENILIEYFTLPIHELKFSDNEIMCFASILVLGNKESRNCEIILKYLSRGKNRLLFLNYLCYLNDSEDSDDTRVINTDKNIFIENLCEAFSFIENSKYSVSTVNSYFYNTYSNKSFDKVPKLDQNKLSELLNNLNHIENKSFTKDLFSI